MIGIVKSKVTAKCHKTYISYDRGYRWVVNIKIVQITKLKVIAISNIAT